MLEVRRGGQAPLVRTRTKSDLGEKDAEKAEEKQQAEAEEASRARKKSKKRKEKVSEALDQVCSTNSPRPPRQLRHLHLAPLNAPFPAIAEDSDFRWTPPPPSASSPSTSASSFHLPPSPPNPPKMSLVEDNRKRLRQRQRLRERILKEPFVSYCKDKESGLLKPMEHPPPPPSFAEPSNKGEYRRVCLLRNEKLAFEEKRTSLENYTTHLLQEGERQRMSRQKQEMKIA